MLRGLSPNLTPSSCGFDVVFLVVDVLLGSANISVARPLLNFFDLGAVFEGVIQGGLAKTVRADPASPKSRNIEADRCGVAFHDVEHGLLAERSTLRCTAITFKWAEEGMLDVAKADARNIEPPKYRTSCFE